MLSRVDVSILNPLPLVETPLQQVSPSPADDYLEVKLDLTEHLVKHPSATYYIKAMGDACL